MSLAASSHRPLNVLALDTAVEATQAAVVAGDRVLASVSEPMQRGHQERLAAMVAEVMAAAGLRFEQLDRVGVTVGPGSFTGLRVGLAFAKGLALARAIPCVGFGTLEAIAAAVAAPGLVAAVIDARRGQVYLQPFEDGRALAPPEALELEDAVLRLSRWPAGLLAGSGADLLGARLPQLSVSAVLRPDPAVLARLAADAPDTGTSPRPLYLRAPDARLPA